MKRAVLAIAGCLWAIAQMLATEEQGHGYAFEQWAHKELFGGFQPKDYTAKWDVPAGVSTRFGGLPVSIKAARLGRAIDLGDALRQFDIAEDFVLLVGFWEQGSETKRFVKIVAATIRAKEWRALWSPVTRQELITLDRLIKDQTLDYRETRRQAANLKKLPPFREAAIQVHPKIDSKRQRRLQCSISFDLLFDKFLPGESKAPDPVPGVNGVRGPTAVRSGPRNLPEK